LSHLKELLAAAIPLKQGVDRVLVWGERTTLDELPEAPWLSKQHEPWLDRSLRYRVLWQRWQLPRLARQAGCTMLFCPGGLAPTGFRPVVTMCRNLLPFEWREMRRYGMSWLFFRLLLLRWAQATSFRQADGVIFLTRYAEERVRLIVGTMTGASVVIPHGVSERFFCKPRPPHLVIRGSQCPSFRILYVSIIDVYKHQWHVAAAVARLRREGLPVTLELVGPAYRPALRHLEATVRQIDPTGECIHYRGFVRYDQLPSVYQEADLFVFASSCENLPNILLESMAAGLPIACSNRGPMPEVLGEAGVYFDPEDPEDIARALRELIESPELRGEKAHMAFERALQYSWRRCADETFAFLASVANGARSRVARNARRSVREAGVSER
jgi:glycosyltransferase involved in cell wall biosynthesis